MTGPIYDAIYNFVVQVPPGKVVSYGQVAKMVGGCTARMVGYAMSASNENRPIPWQRVINAKGRISLHGYGYGSNLQRKLLEEEGVKFNSDGSIDLTVYGWLPPES